MKTNGLYTERYKQIKELQKEGLRPIDIQRRLNITKRDYYNALNYFEKNYFGKQENPIEKGFYTPAFYY
jgi:hypothetical protein